MPDWLLRICQIGIAAAVICGSIWFQEAQDYPINPFIIGAWAFMAAYGFTLAVDWLARRRIIDRGTLTGPSSEQ